MMDLEPPVIAMSGVQFGWPGHNALLNIPNLQVQAGESLFIKGASGSGSKYDGQIGVSGGGGRGPVGGHSTQDQLGPYLRCSTYRSGRFLEPVL